MTQRVSLSLVTVLLVFFGGVFSTAHAQGLLYVDPETARILPPPERHIPWPGPTPGQTTLTLKRLNVQTTITDGVAVTTVAQEFQNPWAQQIEGTYVFPLPADVAVGDFSMTVGDKTLQGEVLDANKARATYEEIVRKLRDPGLLEYIGGRMFRARVFPIPPNSNVAIRLQYTQTLTETGGLGLFQHPLRCASANQPTIEQIAVSATLRSSLPLTTVFCPSHTCDILRPGDKEAKVSYEATNTRPERDFVLYYQRRDADFGLVMLTHRAAGEDGTFMLRISPRVDLSATDVLPKDIAFVIDTSGSMAGDKLVQTQKALTFCINSLRPEDRFNIYAFSTEVHPLRDKLVTADADVKTAAVKFTSELAATGGTNINNALLAALADNPQDAQRVYLVVFMTDGQPTVDVTDPAQIRKNVLEKNTQQTRFHVFGVGTDVNTTLLDSLADATRGARDYCTEKEDLELKLSAFVGRLAAPVLTDLKLTIDGVKTYDIYPSTLPDLFRGNDLVVLGRYGGEGTASVRLVGQVRDKRQELGYEGHFPKLGDDNAFLPRLWANRKVAYLLDQLRLHGDNKELVDEVVRLATRYGIVTPYTAALITEDSLAAGMSASPSLIRVLRAAPTLPPPMMAPGMPAGGQAARHRYDRAGGSGRAAVQQSVAVAQQKDAATADAVDVPAETLWSDGEAPQMRRVDEKTFILHDQRWTDAAWDEKQTPTKIEAFSTEYFALLKEQPELRKYFALGPQVLVVLGDRVFETVPAPEPTTQPDAGAAPTQPDNHGG